MCASYSTLPLTEIGAGVVQLIWSAGNATGTRLSVDEFYSNKLVKDYYKNFVSFILNHVNKQTGLQFKVRSRHLWRHFGPEYAASPY